MVLKNLTTGKIITTELKEAKSFSDQFFGLLKKSNPRYLLFKTRFGIHTFFMKVPIDVLILDNKGKVVAIKKSLKPNRIFFWNPKFCKIIELPEKTIFVTKIKIGDFIHLKD